MAVELRDDVTFHNGDKMTTEDFRYTFFERIKSGVKLDTANSWRKVEDIVIESPTKATMKFNPPDPTAPQWMAFLGSYVVPKKYIETGGLDNFLKKPVGTGPYKLAEYELNSRIVLERNDDYWGPKAKIARVTIEIIKDPSARVAAIQSGQADFTVNVPVREVQRFQSEGGFAAEIDPITRVILLKCAPIWHSPTRTCGSPRIMPSTRRRCRRPSMAAPRCRSRCWRRRERPAICPISLSNTIPISPSSSWPNRASARTSRSKIGFASTNGQFPSDYDIARAIVQMWKKVGIDADLQVIEYAKYFELNRGNKLPEATLYSWDNATGDPEIFSGYHAQSENAVLAVEGSGYRQQGARAVQRRRLRQANRRLSGAGALRGRERSDHAAAAERRDGRAQEKSGLHEIRQWLGAAADAAVELMRLVVRSVRSMR